MRDTGRSPLGRGAGRASRATRPPNGAVGFVRSPAPAILAPAPGFPRRQLGEGTCRRRADAAGGGLDHGAGGQSESPQEFPAALGLCQPGLGDCPVFIRSMADRTRGHEGSRWAKREMEGRHGTMPAPSRLRTSAPPANTSASTLMSHMGPGLEQRCHRGSCDDSQQEIYKVQVLLCSQTFLLDCTHELGRGRVRATPSSCGEPS